MSLYIWDFHMWKFFSTRGNLFPHVELFSTHGIFFSWVPRISFVPWMTSRVFFFGPLYEFFYSSIFQGVRILKILAPGQKKFNLLHPGRSWVRSCVPGVPDHLGTPQWSHMGLKLKICYKNDILRAFFVLWKIFFVYHFLDFL